MNIGLIGANGSGLDTTCLTDMFSIIGITPDYPELAIDLVDLGRGRDFLREDKTYNIVALIFIFRYRREEILDDPMLDVFDADPMYRTSASHMKTNWVRRLISTKASQILVFGTSPSISYSFLGPLPGYQFRKMGRDIGQYTLDRRDHGLNNLY